MAGVSDSKKRAKGRKIGRNKKKCERYRARVGKPNGPGKPGTKSGRNKAPSRGGLIRSRAA